MSNSALATLIESSKNWSDSVVEHDSDFFKKSAQGQSPTYLWIGCVDSRVPIELIGRLQPGDMLTHRNVANQFAKNDISANAFVEFGIGALKIPNIVVCGHTGCGGIKAGIAQAQQDSADLSSNLNRWIAPLAELFRDNHASLDGKSDAEQQNALAAISVATQIENICATDTVKNAWQSNQALAIHGVMYDVGTGQLQDLGLSRYGE